MSFSAASDRIDYHPTAWDEWQQNEPANVREGLDKLSEGRVPVGSVVGSYSTVEFSAAWKEANGQAISRADYPEAFALFGTTYGSGDGSTTFNIPDLRGLSLIGTS
jgi:hypothetical protein